MNCCEKHFSSRCRKPFTKDEDNLLFKLVKQYGEMNWGKISCMIENRTVRQCRERWQNFLSPNVLKIDWTYEEDQLLLQKYNIYGGRWKLLESFFYGRTSYSIRNRLNMLKKRDLRMIDISTINIKKTKHNKNTKKMQKDCKINDLNDLKIVEYQDSIQNDDKFDFDIFKLNDIY